MKFANLTPTPEQCATSLMTGESIVRGTMPLSSGGTMTEPPAGSAFADPVAAAQLRSPVVDATPADAPPARERSPWEPPDEPVAEPPAKPVTEPVATDAPAPSSPPPGPGEGGSP